MTPEETPYQKAGVDTVRGISALRALLDWIGRTRDFSKGYPLKLDIGFFANLIDLGNGQSLAISTDGVGSKILIAEMMDKFDTVGIDCVAMNAGDVLCTGAKPITLVDYLAVEQADERLLKEIGKGLYEGAREADISISGGELAQLPDMIKGFKPGSGFDLVGTCIGLVDSDKIITGRDLASGDELIGLESSGVHSNGLSLARKVLLRDGVESLQIRIPDIGCTLGEELLRPTRIYVKPVLKMIESGLRVKGLAHITGDGLLNILRWDREGGYEIDFLPKPHPIFSLIQSRGNVDPAEMFRVFNMGVGFCVAVDPADSDRVIQTAKDHGVPAHRIGRVNDSPERAVHLKPVGLIGKGDRFFKAG
jgi:phosphoribosylformylglycinamidine cyclo-ligase